VRQRTNLLLAHPAIDLATRLHLGERLAVAPSLSAEDALRADGAVLCDIELKMRIALGTGRGADTELVS
jgi:hypothetical protein